MKVQRLRASKEWMTVCCRWRVLQLHCKVLVKCTSAEEYGKCSLHSSCSKLRNSFNLIRNPINEWILSSSGAHPSRKLDESTAEYQRFGMITFPKGKKLIKCFETHSLWITNYQYHAGSDILYGTREEDCVYQTEWEFVTSSDIEYMAFYAEKAGRSPTLHSLIKDGQFGRNHFTSDQRCRDCLSLERRSTSRESKRRSMHTEWTWNDHVSIA